ncbi:hypothetical protein [Foetidibacter luteolus]|uniref:hypothetical protein n=1 Tax=Foetidibacter luteolus TaxID=2608880 RepID=UPI00129A299A|nr:hypothetical protein [Foetidibacter luteolus]
MSDEKQLSSEESLQLITSMINKAKNSFYDSGISLLLWGSAVSIAAFVTYLQVQYQFSIGFDIWWLVLAAIIPQVIISVREAKIRKVISYDHTAMNAVWITYAITIFGLVAYQNMIPSATDAILKNEGWVLIKHYTSGTKPDEQIRPFTLSVTSIYILIYAFPTLITGIIKRFTAMIIGAVIAYGLFIASFYTSFKYDMVLAGITALVCWFIPGIILRTKYLKLKQKERNV